MDHYNAERQPRPPDDRARGLYQKYQVWRVNDLNGKHARCSYFVLDPHHDRHAAAALKAYADSCETEYPVLADDLRRMAGYWIEE